MIEEEDNDYKRKETFWVGFWIPRIWKDMWRELHSIPIYVFYVNWLFQIFSFYYLCTSNKFKVWGLEFLINSFFHPMINLKIETKITLVHVSKIFGTYEDPIYTTGMYPQGWPVWPQLHLNVQIPLPYSNPWGIFYPLLQRLHQKFPGGHILVWALNSNSEA